MPDDRQNPPCPSAAQQRLLLGLAIAAIRYGSVHDTAMPLNSADYDTSLQKPRATFVTLTKNGRLRGCIGTLTARLPLVEDVVHNAWQAAFHDPRFEPLRPDELQSLHISISILSPPQTCALSSEQELLDKLRPGKDGLIIEEGHHRATFLPSVWHELPEAAAFVEHLKLKAGLPRHYWSQSLTVQLYTSFEFGADVTDLDGIRSR